MYLAGGTALAAHLAHRSSRDLDFVFHGGAVDLDRLARTLQSRGSFALLERGEGTLNGIFDSTRVQFLQAGLLRPEYRVEPIVIMGEMRIAGLGDLLAMKLNAITGRAQLRDYYDIMSIEQRAVRKVEEGIRLFLARYRPLDPGSAIRGIILALGYLDDVGDDPFLPVPKAEIETYWRVRQPALLEEMGRLAGGEA